MILARTKTALLEVRTRLWLAWRALTTNHWDRASQSVQVELRRRNELEWQYSRGYLAGWGECSAQRQWLEAKTNAYEKEIPFGNKGKN